MFFLNKILCVVLSGLSTESLPTNGVSSTTDLRVDSPKPLKNKQKKKGSIGGPLQPMQEKKEKNQQQEMISSSVNGSEDGSGAGASLMNMPSAAAFMNGPMFNPMMMQAGNQFMMPGMMGNGNQMMANMGMMTGTGLPTMQQHSNGSMSNHTPGSIASQGEETDAGLLQLAMQDAGITPSSASGQSSTATHTPSMADTHDSESSSLSQNNPLQTLATVATSNHEMMSEGGASETGNLPPGSMSGSQAIPSSMSSQAGMNNSMMQQPMTSGPHMMNMPGMGPGQQQMQQIMFINEQGIPCIAQVPVGVDPNNPNMVQNGGKQGMMNQQGMMKDQSGNMDGNPAALAMAQQQAMLQNQLLSQGGGASFQNLLQQQQQGLLSGNIIQTPNGPMLQQLGPQMQGQLQGHGQIIGMNSQGQSIVLAGQQNQISLNMPNQLPSALILPNGTIVPVVTNPGSLPTTSQMARMSSHQLQTGGCIYHCLL